MNGMCFYEEQVRKQRKGIFRSVDRSAGLRGFAEAVPGSAVSLHYLEGHVLFSTVQSEFQSRIHVRRTKTDMLDRISSKLKNNSKTRSRPIKRTITNDCDDGIASEIRQHEARAMTDTTKWIVWMTKKIEKISCSGQIYCEADASFRLLKRAVAQNFDFVILS